MLVTVDLISVFIFWIMLIYAEHFLIMTEEDVNDEALTAQDFTVVLSGLPQDDKAMQDQVNLHY